MKHFPGRLHLVCSLALALECEGFSTHRDQHFQRLALKGTTSCEHSPGFWGSSMTGMDKIAVHKQLLEEGA